MRNQIPILATLSTPYQSALHAAGEGLVVLGTLGLAPSGVLHLIDVSSPSAPDVLAELTLPVGPEEVVVDGSLAYVASFVEIYDYATWTEFYVVDVSSPTSPLVLATLPGFSNPQSIAVSEGHVFVVWKERWYAGGPSGVWFRLRASVGAAHQGRIHLLVD